MGKYKSAFQQRRKNFATVLTMVISLMTIVSISSLCVSLLTIMEIINLNPIIIVSIYVPLSCILCLVWIIMHHVFVNRFDPIKNSEESHKITSVDLARIRSSQASYVLICMSNILIYWTTYVYSWPICEGDGHVVINGIDTKSSAYTLWMMFLVGMIVGSHQFIPDVSFIIQVYAVKFTKKFKES